MVAPRSTRVIQMRRSVPPPRLPLGRRLAVALVYAAALDLTGAAAVLAGTIAPPRASAPGDALPTPTPAQMVDALHTAFGIHPARAVHAKGILARGVFTPSAGAKSLTKASLFRQSSVPVTVRFSDFTGIPDIPDTIGAANPRGMAIKFAGDDADDLDIVTHSFNGFPTKTAAEFRLLLVAIGASGPDAPHPNAVEQFLGDHPVAKTFLTTQKPAPVSFATLSYFGVNSFKWTNRQDHFAYVRYRFIPVLGDEVLTAEQIAQQGPNYLREELPRRLAKGPVTYEWYAQIAGAGDAIDDPSVAWPENRALIKLGQIRIEAIIEDQARFDKQTLFLPANVPAGIEPADPMIAIRQGAYPISFRARQ
jgi:catalase